MLFKKKPDEVRCAVRYAARRAGIDYCTPNDLRRTYSTWMRAAGAHLDTIAPTMGHADTRMLQRMPPTNYGLAAIAGFAAPSYALPTAVARSRRPEAAGGRVVGGSGLTARRPDGERTVTISRSTWGWTRATNRSVRCTVCFWTRAMLTSTAISVGEARHARCRKCARAARTPKHGERY